MSVTKTDLLNCWWVRTRPSSRIGNLTSQLPTMFWILKSRNLAGKPSFCTTLAYFLAARRDCSSLQRDTIYTLTPVCFLRGLMVNKVYLLICSKRCKRFIKTKLALAICQVLIKIWIRSLLTKITSISGVVEMVVGKILHLSLQYKQ